MFSAWTGIGVFGFSNHNLITGNYIADNTMYNIRLHWSSENSIVGNNLTNNVVGIQFDNSSVKNVICGNDIADHKYGAWFSSDSSENSVYHNNFENNTVYQIYIVHSVNVFDDGYPSGGNYWSNYNGTDAVSGLYQNESGCDGMGDSAMAFDAENPDHYPLMGRFEAFYAGSWNTLPYFVNIFSNSAISDFSFNASQKCVSFNVSDSSDSGFCRVTIDNSLLGGPYTVLVDASRLTLTTQSNGTHSFFYFAYDHTVQSIRIIGASAVPEFPSITFLPLLMATTLIVAILDWRRISRLRSA